MAKRVEDIFVGVDVSKRCIDVHRSDTGKTEQIPNSREALTQWVAELNGPLIWAIESTNTFHLLLLGLVVERGDCVYVVNSSRVEKYRGAIGWRAKTDARDAELLCRYVERERSDLRPYKPLSARENRLWQLIKQQGLAAKKKTDLRQAFSSAYADSDASLRDLMAAFKRFEASLNKQIRTLMRELGWNAERARCKAIPGVGPANSAALVTAYHRGEWKSQDAFIAFLGLDVRVRDSGKLIGRRKLTKQGEPAIRRLLHNAAMAACRCNSYFGAMKERLMARGLSATAALVAVARKLARLAYTLLSKNRDFDLNRLTGACQST